MVAYGVRHAEAMDGKMDAMDALGCFDARGGLRKPRCRFAESGSPACRDPLPTARPRPRVLCGPVGISAQACGHFAGAASGQPR